MDVDDWTLWQRSRLGDASAFGVLFERHASAIYNYCFRRTGNWAAAEDLLSVVFLEGWRRRGHDVPQDKILPWLYGIATNVVHNQRRSEKRYAAALSRVPIPPTGGGFSERVDEQIDDERRMKQLLAVFARLPRRELEVFGLCGWCDLSYDDAAVALGIPVGTVRSRLSRARARLRKLEPSLTFDTTGEEVPRP